MFDYIVKQWSNQNGLTKYKLERVYKTHDNRYNLVVVFTN